MSWSQMRAKEETLLPFAQTQTNLEPSLECSASLPAQKSGVASPSQTTRLHSRVSWDDKDTGCNPAKEPSFFFLTAHNTTSLSSFS